MEKRKTNNTGKQKKEQEHVGVALYLKREMTALVEQTYADTPPDDRSLMKNFRIHLTEKTSNMLGDTRYWPDNQISDIEIYGVAEQNPIAVVVILIHQITHHIDYILRGTTAHDREFWSIHKDLLTTAFDMGMIKKDKFETLAKADRVHAKASDLMNNYQENPLAYKQDYHRIAIYNVFHQREALKAHGYWWNSLDRSWEIEVMSSDLEKEGEFLATLEIDSDNDVSIGQYEGIVIRHRHFIRVSNVSYESVDTLKRLGYYYQKKGSRVYWEKQFGDELPKSELEELENLQGIKYRIT